MKRAKNMKNIRFTTTLLISALLTAGMSVAQDREERISRTFDIGPNGEFSLSNISGDIRVSGTSGNQLTIEAVKRLHGRGDRDLLERVEVDISHQGNRVRVETRYPHRRRNNHADDHEHGHGGVSVDYRITVPVRTEVEISSVSGDVTLKGVEGETSVSSVSGEIEVSDVANLVKAKSVSGDVEIRNARSDDDVEIASVSGDVTIHSIEAEELSISSVSGDVRIRQVSCEQGEFESVSGDIRYTGQIVSGGYEFTTHSGDVVIVIGEDVGFELEASTFSGEIESEFPMTVTSSSKRRRNISAVVGDGSAVIEATTFSGDVQIRKR